MSSDITPAEFWSGFGRWIGVGLFIAALIAGLVVGGWQAGWWFSNQNATRNYQQTQNGTSNQDTLRAQITQGYVNLTQEDVQIAAAQAQYNPSLTGQLKVEASSQAGDICQLGEQVTGVPLPANQAAWLNTNCNTGVLTPTSKYYISTTP
jgi:hypothetical protein